MKVFISNKKGIVAHASPGLVLLYFEQLGPSVYKVRGIIICTLNVFLNVRLWTVSRKHKVDNIIPRLEDGSPNILNTN